MRDTRSFLSLALTLAAIVLSADLVSTSQTPQAPSPQPQQPVFRAGVELVSVDVAALDTNGRQVTDLAAADFLVDVDGERRQVVSAEYIRSVDHLRVIGAPRKASAGPDETFFTSNAKGAPSGRLMLLLIDQGNIRTGAARAVMNSAKKFVDTLTPEDRVAVVAVPGPGELVDFTTNHDKVREALLRIVGTSDPMKGRFNLSVTEALAVYTRNNMQLAFEVIARECGTLGPGDAERCEREVELDAGQISADVRQRTDASVSGMRTVFQSLAAIEGPKSVILMSEGLIFEGLGGETDDLASIAADARATIDVLLLDVPRFDVTQAERPNTPREDRELQITGLEMLAGAARGSLYRINTSADYAFDQISRALDGFYLLGVEARPEDRNGRRHSISVKSGRRGVTIRSRRSFLTSISAKATTPADAVTRALKSLLPVNDLPLRIATWTYKEPGTPKVRVLIAAEVERLSGQPLDYTAGMLMVNKAGRGFAPAVGSRTLTEKTGDPGTAVFSAAMAVDPGEYRLILSMADNEGRVGSVSRLVTAWQMDGPALAMGDLVVGPVASGAAAQLAPAIEPAIPGGEMAALVEMYGAPAQLAGLEATLDILPSEDAAPLASIPMRIVPGPSPEILAGNAQFNTTALPPGRYLARSTIRQGGKAQGHMIRPFRILTEAPSLTGAAPASSTGGALPSEMVGVLLGGLGTFDRKELLTPAALTPMFAAADGRPGASKAAVKEARGGDLGSAAMTALGDGDQALAAFFKGLELLQSSQLDKAAVQFQSAMQIAPTFTPARLYLGAALAEANRHKDAAGLIQSAASSPANASAARLAGEEWLKAGQPALAIPPLELAMQQPGVDARTRKLMGIAYVLGGRPADAVPVLTPYLEANPADQSAQLAAIFGTYIRHLNAPQPATLAADKANVAKWSKAYTASKGGMQPLVTAWVKHVQGLK
jgi:VWFA-related protein